MKGFIPVKRSLFDHFLFKEQRSFSRFEAWVDLIQLASFLDGQTDLIKGKLITRNRGEVIASVRWLCKRWDWSIHKVCDYIELLRTQKMVSVDKDNGIQKIKLVNFEKHNSIGNTDWNPELSIGNQSTENRGTQNILNNKLGNKQGIIKGNSVIKNSTAFPTNEGTQIGTSHGTLEEHKGNSDGTNYKKGKKDKKIKMESSGAVAPSSTPEGNLNEKKNKMAERQKEFYKELIPYVAQYSKEMIRAFYNYWSEPNKSLTKMKFQLETTWDLSRRLTTWDDNDRRWQKNGAGINNKQRNEEKPPVKTLDDELRYLVDRYVEGELDERLIHHDYYDKLQVRGLMPLGSLDNQPGATIEEKKRQAVLKFIKANSNVGS